MWKKTLPALLVAMAITACNSEHSTSPVIEPTPEIVAPETSYAGPQTGDPTALPVQEYITRANSQNAELAEHFDDITHCLTGDLSFEDGTWTWTYDEGLYTHTLSCEIQGTLWYWTYTVDGGEFENWVAADGFSGDGGSSAWWKFYEIGTTEVAFSAERSGTTAAGIIYWYEHDFMSGGLLILETSWTYSANSQSATIVVPNESKIAITENSDYSGELYIYDWTDSWDLTFEAQWNGNGSGSYTNYVTGNTVSWG